MQKTLAHLEVAGILQKLHFDMPILVADLVDRREVTDDVPCRPWRCGRIELWVSLDLREERSRGEGEELRVAKERQPPSVR